jgi:hypothetical protein
LLQKNEKSSSKYPKDELKIKINFIQKTVLFSRFGKKYRFGFSECIDFIEFYSMAMFWHNTNCNKLNS